MRAFGATLPASDAAMKAPQTIPMSITDVTSSSTGRASAARGNPLAQNTLVDGSQPSATAALAPHSVNAQVIDHGWPATSSVAQFSNASKPAPNSSGHGPRSSRRHVKPPAHHNGRLLSAPNSLSPR